MGTGSVPEAAMWQVYTMAHRIKSHWSRNLVHRALKWQPVYNKPSRAGSGTRYNSTIPFFTGDWPASGLMCSCSSWEII